ncbi:MAG: hypothetical protein P4M15_15435 [Alphaproteobacteria bacterium]|nr:hypothetical protein [Alphaproteobacteria bacterium]
MMKNTVNARIAAAALHLAATQGWQAVTLAKIGKAAKTSMEAFKNTAALAPVIAEEIDREAFAGKVSGNTHDKLFELLMARFDIMQKHRKGILSMAEAARHDRALGCALALATGDGIYRLIEAAHIDTLPAPRPFVAATLGLVYGWAFLAWRRDESRDMAKTMAALDRGLRYADKAAEFATKYKSSDSRFTSNRKTL